MITIRAFEGGEMITIRAFEGGEMITIIGLYVLFNAIDRARADRFFDRKWLCALDIFAIIEISRLVFADSAMRIMEYFNYID